MKKTVIAMLLFVLLLCLTGCQKPIESVADNGHTASGTALEEYMTTVKAQSDAINASLEQEELTQTDMNQKSQELCDLWEAALGRLLDEAKGILSAAEMEKLTAEQSEWLESKANAVEAAGRDVSGGSMYALVVNSESAKLMQARAYELFERLK